MNSIPIGFNRPHDAPPSLIDIARERLASTGYRCGATRTYRVPGITTGLNGGEKSSPLPLKWNANGIVIGAYGQVQSADDADAAAMSARIQVSGTEDLITDGSSGAFGTFSALFGKTQNWYPLSRAVYTGMIWNITFFNENLSASAILPAMFFTLIEEAPDNVKQR